MTEKKKTKVLAQPTVDVMLARAIAARNKWESRFRFSVKQRLRAERRIAILAIHKKNETDETKTRIVKCRGVDCYYWRDAPLDSIGISLNQKFSVVIIKKLISSYPTVESLERMRISEGFSKIDFIGKLRAEILEQLLLAWLRKYATDYVLRKSKDDGSNKTGKKSRNGVVWLQS